MYKSVSALFGGSECRRQDCEVSWCVKKDAVLEDWGKLHVKTLKHSVKS